MVLTDRNTCRTILATLYSRGNAAIRWRKRIFWGGNQLCNVGEVSADSGQIEGALLLQKYIVYRVFWR